MIVICRGNSGAALLQEREAAGYTAETVFHLTMNEQYPVHAMALGPSGLNILVVDDTRRPRWQPIELFDIQDGRLPEGWEFALVEDGVDVKALWGYSSLIRDADHHDNLAELDPRALQVFLSETGNET